MNLKSHTIPQLWNALGENYRLFSLDTAGAGADDLLFGTDSTDVAHDVTLHHELQEWPQSWTLDELTPADLAGAGYQVNTRLSDLRQFPGWQDAGQTDDDESLTDDTPITIAADGSISTANGFLAEPAYQYPLTATETEWYAWIGSRYAV